MRNLKTITSNFNPSAEIPGFKPGDECGRCDFCCGREPRPSGLEGSTKPPLTAILLIAIGAFFINIAYMDLAQRQDKGGIIFTRVRTDYSARFECLRPLAYEARRLTAQGISDEGLGVSDDIFPVGGMAWNWQWWSKERDLEDPLAQKIWKFLQDINPKIQKSLALLNEWNQSSLERPGEVMPYTWRYPTCCTKASLLGGLCILGKLSEAERENIDIYWAGSGIFAAAPDTYRRKYAEEGLRHDWLILRVNGAYYYVSFTDGLFAWNMDVSRADLLRKAVGNNNTGGDRKKFKREFIKPYREGGFDQATFIPWEEAEQYLAFARANITLDDADIRIFKEEMLHYCDNEIAKLA